MDSRSVLTRVGRFSSNTAVEDMDVTVSITEAGHRIGLTALAVTFAEAPRSLVDWMRQRHRWTYGGFHVLWEHRHMIFRPNYGPVGMIGLPFFPAFPWIEVLISTPLSLSVG